MSDLLVDFRILTEAKATADGLHERFVSLPDRVGDQSDIWGHSRIRDAMHTFGTNWGYHREVLADEISEVGDKVEGCLTAFRDADRELADQLEKQAAAAQQQGGAR